MLAWLEGERLPPKLAYYTHLGLSLNQNIQGFTLKLDKGTLPTKCLELDCDNCHSLYHCTLDRIVGLYL